MTDKISTRTPELKRRLEYAKRIRKAVDYKGTADHEDVQSILRKFQEEITKEFTDRIVEQLEEELRLSEIEKRRCVAENAMQFDSAKGYYNGIDNALAIVKGVQNE